MSPLKQARKKRGWTLEDVVKRIRQSGRPIDTGNLSRIERGIQRPSADLAESICTAFDGEISELHLIYPERFRRNERRNSSAA